MKKEFELPDLAAAVAHQWFPLKIGVKDQGADAWLVDGMAVFASLMYFEKTLSPADAQEHINKALVRALGYESSIAPCVCTKRGDCNSGCSCANLGYWGLLPVPLP